MQRLDQKCESSRSLESKIRRLRAPPRGEQKLPIFGAGARDFSSSRFCPPTIFVMIFSNEKKAEEMSRPFGERFRGMSGHSLCPFHWLFVFICLFTSGTLASIIIIIYLRSPSKRKNVHQKMNIFHLFFFIHYIMKYYWLDEHNFKCLPSKLPEGVSSNNVVISQFASSSSS